MDKIKAALQTSNIYKFIRSGTKPKRPNPKSINALMLFLGIAIIAGGMQFLMQGEVKTVGQASFTQQKQPGIEQEWQNRIDIAQGEYVSCTDNCDHKCYEIEPDPDCAAGVPDYNDEFSCNDARHQCYEDEKECFEKCNTNPGDPSGCMGCLGCSFNNAQDCNNYCDSLDYLGAPGTGCPIDDLFKEEK